MNNTTNMPCAAPNHKRCDASEISGASRENSGAGEPRPGQGGRDAGGMQASNWNCPEWRRLNFISRHIGHPGQFLVFKNKRRGAVWAKTGGRCFYCGIQTYGPNVGFASPEDPEARGLPARLWIEVDHFVARSLGGSDRIENLVPACADCNQWKSGSSVSEFRRAFRARYGSPFFYGEIAS